MKSIGKPCAGKPHARFDEGALRKQVPGTRSSRVRRGVCKRAKETAESVLYSTLFPFPSCFHAYWTLETGWA